MSIALFHRRFEIGTVLDPLYEDEKRITFSYNQMLFQQDHDELL